MANTTTKMQTEDYPIYNVYLDGTRQQMRKIPLKGLASHCFQDTNTYWKRIYFPATDIRRAMGLISSKLVNLFDLLVKEFNIGRILVTADDRLLEPSEHALEEVLERRELDTDSLHSELYIENEDFQTIMRFGTLNSYEFNKKGGLDVLKKHFYYKEDQVEETVEETAGF